MAEDVRAVLNYVRRPRKYIYIETNLKKKINETFRRYRKLNAYETILLLILLNDDVEIYIKTGVWVGDGGQRQGEFVVALAGPTSKLRIYLGQ